MKCPCRGCLDRTLTCHGVCERFAEWKEEQAKKKAWLNGFRYETSDGARRGERAKLIRQARGQYKRKGGKKYE